MIDLSMSKLLSGIKPFKITKEKATEIMKQKPSRGNFLIQHAIKNGFYQIVDEQKETMLCNEKCLNCNREEEKMNTELFPWVTQEIKDSPLASDTMINYLCVSHPDKPLFSPYVNAKQSKDIQGRGIPSYGLSSTGYDIRCDGKVLAFVGTENDVVDPRQVNHELFKELPVHEDGTGRYVLIPPKAFILSASLEHVNIPRTHMAIVNTKSTYARAGLQTLTTPLESFWSGYITLEFVNHTDSKIKLYIDGGIVQVNLFKSDGVYKDYIQAGGKYQNQASGVVHGKC